MIILKKSTCVILIAAILFSFTSCVKTNKIAIRGEELDNAAATTQKENLGTYTARKPLVKVEFTVTDNIKGFSTELIEHSYGVAKDGKPHDISVSSQKFFEEKGFSAVTYDSHTENKIYLTFDCGYENGNTSKILDVLKKKNIKAAFFCTLDNIKAEPDLIARMINEGHIVGNHSTTHPSFDKLSRAEMVKELEDCENYLREKFGYSSKFFRFPMGNYSESALDMISSLDITCVFWSLAYADWNTSNQKGAEYAFEKVTQRLHPGAIILLHSVSKDNADALDRIIACALNSGYKFSTLDELNLSYSNYNT